MRLSKARLNEMIEEATVDCYGEEEEASGWFTMFENELTLPFDTEVLGVTVTVETIDLTDGYQIMAVCKRGRHRQRIAIQDLPLPSPLPAGAEWIEAYRRWLRGRL